jgi:NADH-quinone oxidoreductase subunit N
MYVLILYDAPSILSLEAGAKYFYLSALSSGLISSGLLLMYIWLMGTKFWYVTYIIYGLTNVNIEMGIGIIALSSIIYGFLFKLAAFPCHLWAPEIYAGSPNVTMAFFILPIKVATLAVFIKLLTCVFKDIYIGWSYMLWFSSILSMTWGCLGAYMEDKMKKFIAYSSINQMGFLLIGITCGAFDGIRATIIYLLIYIIMNWGFLQLYLATWNKQTKRNVEYIPELKYFARHNWMYSMGMSVILFSMAGIPPLAGFFGKYFLFLIAFQSEYYLLILVGMITSLISTFYYLRIIKIMWFEDTSYTSFGVSLLKTHLTFFQRQMFFISEILIIFFILWSKFLFNLTTVMTTTCQFI